MGNTLNEELKGLTVIIAAEHLRPEFAAPHLRVFRVRGGFGASPIPVTGNALFGTFLADGESCRMEGWQVERFAEPAEFAAAMAASKERS